MMNDFRTIAGGFRNENDIDDILLLIINLRAENTEDTQVLGIKKYDFNLYHEAMWPDVWSYLYLQGYTITKSLWKRSRVQQLCYFIILDYLQGNIPIFPYVSDSNIFLYTLLL